MLRASTSSRYQPITAQCETNWPIRALYEANWLITGLLRSPETLTGAVQVTQDQIPLLDPESCPENFQNQQRTAWCHTKRNAQKTQVWSINRGGRGEYFEVESFRIEKSVFEQKYFVNLSCLNYQIFSCFMPFWFLFFSTCSSSFSAKYSPLREGLGAGRLLREAHPLPRGG